MEEYNSEALKTVQDIANNISIIPSIPENHRHEMLNTLQSNITDRYNENEIDINSKHESTNRNSVVNELAANLLSTSKSFHQHPEPTTSELQISSSCIESQIANIHSPKEGVEDTISTERINDSVEPLDWDSTQGISFTNKNIKESICNTSADSFRNMENEDSQSVGNPNQPEAISTALNEPIEVQTDKSSISLPFESEKQVESLDKDETKQHTYNSLDIFGRNRYDDDNVPHESTELTMLDDLSEIPSESFAGLEHVANRSFSSNIFGVGSTDKEKPSSDLSDVTNSEKTQETMFQQTEKSNTESEAKEDGSLLQEKELLVEKSTANDNTEPSVKENVTSIETESNVRETVDQCLKDSEKQDTEKTVDLMTEKEITTDATNDRDLVIEKEITTDVTNDRGLMTEKEITTDVTSDKNLMAEKEITTDLTNNKEKTVNTIVDCQKTVDSTTVDNEKTVDSTTVDNEKTVDSTTVDNERTVDSTTVDNEKTVDSTIVDKEMIAGLTESNKDKESTETVKDVSEKEKSSNSKGVDGISFDKDNNREGADAELCIIPDTERVISQAERDAASSMRPLRDISEASTSSQVNNTDGSSDKSDGSSIVVFKHDRDDLEVCNQCKLKRKVQYYYCMKTNGTHYYLCDDNCLNDFKNSHANKVVLNWVDQCLRVKDFNQETRDSVSLIRRCASCKRETNDINQNLTWEIMDFCNEHCLTKYQKDTGSQCSNCKGDVQNHFLGKYCVRFGNDIRQFCTSTCLDKYKKFLRVCSYCQQDISAGDSPFVAPVGDKGQFKDFCSQICMEKYDIMATGRTLTVPPGTICSVCKKEKTITIEFELDSSLNYFCGEICFVAFSFVKNIKTGKCAMCSRHFQKSTLEKHSMYYDNVQYSFCSTSCENIYIIANRKIVNCSWCKVKKYNFDMIRQYNKQGSTINMCSVNCLNLYRFSIERNNVCSHCHKVVPPLYHLKSHDGVMRSFCTYNCVTNFQNKLTGNIGAAIRNREESPISMVSTRKGKRSTGTDTNVAVSDVPVVPVMPIVSSYQSLANTNGTFLPPPPVPSKGTRFTRSKSSSGTSLLASTPRVISSLSEIPFQVQIKHHFILKQAPIPDQRTVATMCSTKKMNVGISATPTMVDQEVQTDEREAIKILIPVPIPIYVPTPMHMYSTPTPVPVPIPIPIPVPIFIPTTRNSAAGIMKEIKKIQVKIPTDPYEAELLMMAEMVAEEKKDDITDSESDVDDTGGPEDSYSPEPVDASNTFGDDMLQMALKMATELDEPAVDLEGALTANTITGGEPHHPQDENVDETQPMHHHMMERSPSARGRKRGMRQARGGTKRGRRMSHHQVDMPMMQHHQVQQPPPPSEPAEKPDANMCLKYTFGVNAWKQWVTTKNSDLEKTRHVKLFKTEILQLTADELNFSLCLFVKEVRKPNGAEYAPDTIYYLCLGIQQYLFENGRIDNIFCDPYYEKFTDCLDEVAKKFSILYNDSHYIVTRVEEEHLWESKQLGAHSPHVLLSTLMFFNTKHFNLTSVDEHMQLSFSHIMKHWKRNPNQPGASKVPGSRNVLLRFYPPQSAIQNNVRKKKVYEQQENEENPLRCPVKLYEFYLSKCPESVKTRNDVFYLQPERSCVPDSPVWYSTMPLPREALEKMLHRVKMVKEINVALLTS
ncbi:zinc finger MYM-type protein 3 isoform X2 [Diabrotica virgifera virgifera]|uniref:TRASH domain-containing protein n=1 Tax=Diabrotica virgifera virgifera TaxID=50390 RepID=A0ABM5JH93_DIAVI|nr:zinc finger MYM-type protein 3 isoform X2 [Diabrotica virgifera virgifera]